MRRFTAPDEPGLLTQVAEHAHPDHGLDTIPDALVEQVRRAVVGV